MNIDKKGGGVQREGGRCPVAFLLGLNLSRQGDGRHVDTRTTCHVITLSRPLLLFLVPLWLSCLSIHSFPCIL